MKNCELTDYGLMRYVSTPDHHGKAGLAAYTVTSPKLESYEMQVVVHRLLTGESFTVSAGGQRESDPHFSPDGRSLAFLSDVTGEEQIWLADLDQKTVRQLTSMRYGAGAPVWSPDSCNLAFVSRSRPGEDSQLLQVPESVSEKEDRARLESLSPVIIDDYGYKSDDSMGFTRQTVSHVWVVPADGGPARQLTDGDRDHIMPAWSPDSCGLVFASNRCRSREESLGMDLFSVPSVGGKLKRLTENVWIAWYPKAFQPLFTQDGQFIIIGALSPDGSGGMPPTRLFRVPADGGEATCLWPPDAPCHEATCFIYNAEGYGSSGASAQISEDGRYIYFLSGWAGACDIYRAALYGEPAVDRVTSGRHCVRSLCRPQNGQILISRGTFTMTPQLEILDLADSQITRVTDTNAWLRERPLSDALELRFQTLDGKAELHGLVIPPHRLEQGDRCPAVLYIHGGPMPFFGYALTYEYQLLAAAGYVVLLCNPRGTGGYGAGYGRTEQAFDGTAATDLLQFADVAARTFSWVDGERIGVAGGSYGGYMAAWLAARTDRFRAAVCQRGVYSNLISYASSDLAGSSRDYKDFTDFMKAEIRKSPVAWADQINIPLLILHSLGDMRCPVEQAHQLYTAVKDTHPDLPVRMVLFPDSNHGLTMVGPLHLRIAHYRETIAWFDRYLKED